MSPIYSVMSQGGGDGRSTPPLPMSRPSRRQGSLGLEACLEEADARRGGRCKSGWRLEAGEGTRANEAALWRQVATVSYDGGCLSCMCLRGLA